MSDDDDDRSTHSFSSFGRSTAKAFKSKAFKSTVHSFGASSAGSSSPARRVQRSTPLPPEDPDDMIIEIVNGRHLLIEDAVTSDPYVAVTTKGGRETFHKTKHIKRNLNPDYAPKHDNLFYLPISYVDRDGGVRLELMDKDRFRSDEPLGLVRLPSESLRNAAAKAARGKGGELTFDVRPPVTRIGENAGTITIRCRPATDFRESFRSHLRRGKTSSTYLGAQRTEDVLAPRKPRSASPRKPRSASPRKPPGVGSRQTSDASASSAYSAAGGGADDSNDLIVEIAYCRGLLKEDAVASDPYVIVHVEGGVGGGRKRKFHKTKFLFQTLNPDYTPKQDSLFYLPSSYLDEDEDSYEDGFVVLELKDHDTLGKDEPLGSVRIKSKSIRMAPVTLREAAGEMTFDVTPPAKRSDENAGRITIRCRPASDFVEPFRLHLKRGRKSSAYPQARAETKDDILVPDAPRDKPPPEVGPRGLLTETVVAISTGTAKAVHGTAKVATKVATADVSAIKEVCPVTAVVDRVHRAGSVPPQEAEFGTAEEFDEEGDESGGGAFVPPPTEPDDLVVEISSCEGLLAAGHGFTTDPFVVVKIGSKQIHATKYIKRTRNPTYTPALNSLFYLSSRDVNAAAESGGDDDDGNVTGGGRREEDAASVLFKAIDYDKRGLRDELGGAAIPVRRLREAAFRSEEEEEDFDDGAAAEAGGGEVTSRLVPPPDRKGADAGSIVLRCRPATDFEEAFLDHLKRRRKSSKFPGIGSSVEETVLKPPEERRLARIAVLERHENGFGAEEEEDGSAAATTTTTDRPRKKKKKKKKKKRRKKGSRDGTDEASSALSEPLLDDDAGVNEREMEEEADDKNESCMTRVCRRCGFC